jgi:hypothetical protein
MAVAHHISRSALAGFALSLFASIASAETLGPSEISRELIGRHIAWWEQAGWRHGHLYLLPGGRAELFVDRPERRGDVGRWHVEGDTLCTRWDEMRAGEEKCYRISRSEDGLFLTTGGNVFELRELGI